ncbi:MAG TPA: type II toxin-antitoxin system RelE/ParE family toxin [Chthoniobacterales bacterium]|nr:type II toxin-antitoxin system RelE/ParE family toxin [Chthoniobacterales bacterium]
MRLRILGLAEADLLRGFRFYERQASGVGWYFLETLNSDIESLRLYAGVHPRVFGYYRLLSKRFPFAVYYDVREEEVRVSRVLDCRRDPRWITAQVRKGRKSR